MPYDRDPYTLEAAALAGWIFVGAIVGAVFLTGFGIVALVRLLG